jgi:predicted nucleic acid-binding protein
MAIVSCLVDTNILLRIARRSDPQHQAVDAALARLAEQGTILCYTHQNIAELWNVMTRPVSSNGLGLSAAETDLEVNAIEAGMSLLPDSAAVYQVQDFAKWKAAYDGHLSTRKTAGLTERYVLRNADNPNEVFVLFEASDLDKARAFASSGRSASEDAGSWRCR